MPTPAMVNNQAKATSIITLMPEQTIRDVNALHATLMSGLRDADHIRIGAAALVQVDTAVLQLLCAFMLEARQRGVEVIWDPPSEALVSAARLLGVSGILGLE